MKLQTIITIFAAILFSKFAFAQVATPNLDFTEPVFMPAVSGWSKQSSVAGSYLEENGDRKLDVTQIYEYDTTGSSGTIAISFESFEIDGYSSAKKTDVSLDQYYDGTINTKLTESFVSIALSGEGSAAIGIGVHNSESVDYISPQYESQTTKQSGVTGSISFFMLESIFIGLGVEKIKEETDYTVDNDWIDRTAGIALWFGRKTNSQFRLEVSVTESPESEEEESTAESKEANHHYKTSTSRANLEIMFNGLLFSGSSKREVVYKDYTNSNNNEEASQIVRTWNTGSVLWIPKDGLVLGFSFETYENDEIFVDSLSTFSVKLGYVF